jgi:hypothetical protein
MAAYRTRFADLSRRQAWAVIALTLAATAYLLFLGLTHDTGPPKVPGDPKDPLAGNDPLLFRRLVQRVHRGEDYYDAAYAEHSGHGFPVASMFNWRLPTFTWVIGALPDPYWAQVLLGLLSLVALVLACLVQRRELGLAGAGLTLVLLYGLFVFATGPVPEPVLGHEMGAVDAVFSPEMWAAVLLAVSVGALGVGLRSVGVVSGILALCFRELVLPYCLIAGVLAWWHGRWREAVWWALGIALFAGLLVYHGWQVAQRLEGTDRTGGGLGHWFQFTGMWFDLVATRCNFWLAFMPGWVLALYLCAGIFGLAAWRSELGTLLALTTAAFLVAFAIIARPYNYYWGLLYAPLLPFGVVYAPAAIRDLVRAVRGAPAQT